MASNSTLRLALSVAFLGSLAFIFGVVAENKKPASGTASQVGDVVICKFPSDPTVVLGSFSIITLVAASIVGHFAVFFPYNGKSVPREVLFRSTSLLVFFFIAEAVSVLSLVMMIWPTITEGLHISRNVHHVPPNVQIDLSTQCPTAKTGLFGGAAFLALDATLFWLVSQMLTLNARADYLDENDPKGEYGQFYSAEYESNNGPGAKV